MSKTTIYLKYESDALQYAYSDRGPFEPIRTNTQTTVLPGDEVEWVCAKESNLASISISKKSDSSPDVFIPNDPHEVNVQCWLGTTSSSIDHVEIENYNITYTTSGGQTETFDPQIKVDPGDGGDG